MANRNVRFAGILNRLGCHDDCNEALSEGSSLLSNMFSEVDPAFLNDVIEFEELKEFLDLCARAGCPVKLPRETGKAV